jgi:hypothetical protein
MTIRLIVGESSTIKILFVLICSLAKLDAPLLDLKARNTQNGDFSIDYDLCIQPPQLGIEK